MPVTRSPSFCKTLRAEMATWVEQGFIDQQKADALLGLYTVSESKSQVIGLLTILGSVLVGLVVILFGGQIGIIFLLLPSLA